MTIEALGGNDPIQNFEVNSSTAGGVGNDTLVNKTSYENYDISYVPETKMGNAINLSDTIVKRYRITITTLSSEESIVS